MILSYNFSAASVFGRDEGWNLRVSQDCICLCLLLTKSFLIFFFFRYVRIVGTHNTVNKVFHLVAFECMFTNRPYTLDNCLLGKLHATYFICFMVLLANYSLFNLK